MRSPEEQKRAITEARLAHFGRCVRAPETSRSERPGPTFGTTLPIAPTEPQLKRRIVVRRSLVALPTAALLTIGVAGTALATHCGVDNKPDGAGQHAVILINPVTDAVTPIAVFNKAGKFTGGFVDVYLDFDLSGTITPGDGKINDTFVISEHSGGAAPGQEEGGLAVIPSIIRGDDPAGEDSGVGFADFTIVGA